jgi:hypothetical protein
MTIIYPDYKNSLLALSASVLIHYGVTTPHATLPTLDRLFAKNYKNVVVMLFDGMGKAILEHHLSPETFLRRHLTDTILSVFPSTTTAATTTMYTGCSPAEHGWLGWSLYFPEAGGNVNIYPNTLFGLGGKPAADYHVAGRYLKYKTITRKISEASDGFINATGISPYSEHKAGSVGEICSKVTEICRAPRRSYIYTYWPQPDQDMHELGTGDPKITEIISDINASVEALCRELRDTLVIVTADHGLLDTGWLYLADYPDVMDCLVRLPSIEPRALSFFVKDGRGAEFETAFQRNFGEYFMLLTKEEVKTARLFGGGEPHPRTDGFIGDYLAVATGDISIDCSPTPDRGKAMKAAHAGLTEDEMRVPLIAVECK